MSEKWKKIKYKLKDHMLLGSIWDQMMMKYKYRGPKLSFLYNVMVAQKHRMIYYKSLKEKYFDKCICNRSWEQLEKQSNPDTVWVCWMQGMNQAPELVHRCYESLKKNLPHKKIIVIDENNIFDYVTMPDYIVQKWRDGIMGTAHFTDLLRLELLIKYGGYWIDATVLCTDGKMLEYIDKEPLFMYSFYYFGFNPEIMETNNWFIYSTTNSNVLCLQRELLYQYWKEENRAVNYFLFHIFMTMVLDYYKEDYQKMPIISQVDAHVLATYIYDTYEQRKFDILKLSTGFHKLSTRFETEKLVDHSFYDMVVRQGKY
ncbi:MAG: capsular polysaccharide synthesis protein [Lachnospiraceae bacterium]|nr:capsular polysaccharide synthesis protein [Lachnospiraceae bacterium]